MDEREQLEQAIAALEAQRAVLGDGVVDPMIAAARAQLATPDRTATPQPALKGERKLVTVMFADISGFTALAERMDPEAVRDLMNGCFEQLVPVIKKYGGTVDKFIGDEIMALFGAPVAHENDSERALRAALEMMETLAAFNAEQSTDLGLHFGINTGLVIAGGLGTEERQEYSVMGDAVNLAARLEDVSERGEILVGPDTYRHTAPLFELESLEPVQVKGKAEPVPIYRLLAAKAVPGRVRGIAGLDSPLVGREVEMAALRDALGHLQSGQGGVVTLVGEAGLGKSRLVAELRAVAFKLPTSHLHWIEGRCLSYGGSLAYLLWLDVLRGLLGVTAEDPPLAVRETLRQRIETLCPTRAVNVYPYLGRLLSLPLEEDVAIRLKDLEGESLKNATFRAVETLLECAAQERPLVLVCEDLHWADPTSLELLEQILPLIERVPLLLVILSRPYREHGCWRIKETVAATHPACHVDLQIIPLSAAESSTLMGNLLRVEGLPPRLRERILGRAEGNPFFVEEIIRSLINDGIIVHDEATGRWQATREAAGVTIPDTLQGVLAARIDRLQEETKRILQLAAVIGRIFLYRVLAAIAAEERALDRHLLTLQEEELIRERALAPELEYIFKHHLTQEAAYNGLLRKERRIFHHQVAETLERLFPERTEEQVGLLAYHWERAEVPEKAIEYLSHAGDHARLTYSHKEAIMLYGRAIQLAESVSLDVVSLAGLHRGRGLASEMLGGFDQADSDHQVVLQIARAASNPQVEWRALIDLGRLWASRDYHQTRDYFESALKLARQMDDPAALADSLNWMGNWHVNAEDPQTAIKHHREALKIVEALGDRRGLANTLDLLGLANLLRGDLAASIQYYDRAIALFRELDNRPRLASSLMGRATNVSVLAFWSVLVPVIPSPDAAADFNEVLQITREIDLVSEKIWAHWSLGMFHALRGDFGRALEEAQNGLRVASEIGHREWVVGTRATLGALYVELLAPQEALQQLKEALTLARELRSQNWIHNVTGSLAGAYFLLDDLPSAQACLETVLSPQTPMDTATICSCWARQAELALAQSDPALALDIIDRLIASVPGMAPGRVVTSLWRLKGEALAAMGQTEKACSLLRAALENARAAGERSLLWRIHASLGQLYRAMGRQAEAQQEFSVARNLVQELADTIPDKALKENFVQRAYTMLETGDQIK